MASNKPAPYLAPDLQKQRMELARNQMMAEQLLKYGSQPNEGRMVGGHWIPPDAGKAIANAFSLYAGYKGLSDMPEKQMQLQQAEQRHMMDMFGLGASASPTSAPMQGDAQAMPVDVSGGSSGTNPQMLGQALGGGQGRPQIPLLPGRDPMESFVIAQNIGMPEYMKLVAQQGAPTNEQRNLSHLAPSQRNQLLEGEYLQKAAKDGVQMIRGEDGRIYSVPVQGYAQSQAALQGGITGAQEQARASYDLVEVPDGQGGTMMMPRSQAVQSLGGGQQGAAATGQQQAQTGQFGRSPSSGQKSYDAEIGKRFANQCDQLQSGAANSREMLGMYDLAEQALNSGVRTGIGAEAELTLRQLGAAMGIDTNPEKVSGGELIRSVQNRMALIMRNPEGGMGMPGAISDRDIKFLKDSQVGIDRTPEGNRKMLTAFRAIEQRKVEMAQMADDYVQRNGRIDAGFNRVVRDYAEANPLFAASEPEARAQQLDSILGF